MAGRQSERKLTSSEHRAVVAQRESLASGRDHRRDAVWVVAGEVLAFVPSDAHRRIMTSIASQHHVTCIGNVTGLPHVIRFRSDDHATAGPAEVVELARRSGVEAGPNHVMALGGIMKWIPGDVPQAGRDRWSPVDVAVDGTDKWVPGHRRAASDGEPAEAGAGPMHTGWVPALAADDRDLPHAPLVVVVDTGFRAAGRTDGVLDGVIGDSVAGAVIDLDPAHGTFVAGVVRQVAPEARVHVVRAFGRDGVATDSAVATKVLEAGHLIAAHGGRGVISLSWGCETFDDRPPLATTHALSSVCSDDIAIVAAAGNDGRSRPWFPARLPGVVSVGALALDADELRGAVWSNRGDAIDVSTVGEGVVSTFVTGRIRAVGDAVGRGDVWDAPNPYAAWSGTSFAAPQIAGRVAEMLVTNPDEPASAVVKLLADDPSARDIEGFGVALRIL